MGQVTWLVLQDRSALYLIISVLLLFVFENVIRKGAYTESNSRRETKQAYEQILNCVIHLCFLGTHFLWVGGKYFS